MDRSIAHRCSGRDYDARALQSTTRTLRSMRFSRRSEVRAALQWSHYSATVELRCLCAAKWAQLCFAKARSRCGRSTRFICCAQRRSTCGSSRTCRRAIGSSHSGASFLPVVPLTVPPQRSVRVPRASDAARRAVRGHVMRSYAVAACHAQRCALRRVPHRHPLSCDADPTTPFAGGRRGPSAEHLADEDAERTSRA